MSLITVTGYPASGKSTRAAQLKTFLQNHHDNVHILSDHSLDISRDVYDDSRTEKAARSTLFSSMQRLMSSNAIVIVDAPNYIKGFRYQMYCAARELKLRVCTIYVVAKDEQCRKWNAARPDNEKYSNETLENLIQRYEEPSSMVRWDSPLFTVLWSDEQMPLQAIWESVSEGKIKPPNSGTVAVSKAPSDALLILEKTCLSIVTELMNIQDGYGGMVKLSGNQIQLPPRRLTLPELQRLKRQFVQVHKKAITLGTVEKGSVDWDEGKVAHKFVVYLEEHLRH
ncbi:chromatin associated protein KTI12 [Dendrothele bispora CBS 962.96]|uniref:Chromatin associated protein KTI12 n=1 Tax=Dendrothele bispora (strain CBS 962.96) TaxID=1314807 RepID=A0A4S8M010_DENBC|nr:chromatin associated protein KTI12 [Dendrothele bispora CBS 962.96]